MSKEVSSTLRDGQLTLNASLSAILLLSMAGVSLIFDIAVIILFARHRLNPVTFLVLSTIKSVFWIFLFVVDIIDAVRGDTNLGLAFLFSAVLFCTSVGQLIYGAVITHRKRRGIYAGRGTYGGVGGADGLGYRGANATYDQTPRVSVSYASGGAPPNPFRDPSREPSPAAAQRVPLTAGQGPTASHPAFRSGENESYYNNEPAHGPSFEMQTAYRDS